MASWLDESNIRTGLKLSRTPPESRRDLATTVPRRTRTRAMTKTCRGQIASGPCLGSRRAPRKFRPSGDVAALKWSATALRPCQKLSFRLPPNGGLRGWKRCRNRHCAPGPGRVPSKGGGRRPLGDQGCLRAALPEQEGPSRFGQPSPTAGRGVAGNHHVTELITQGTPRSVSAM